MFAYMLVTLVVFAFAGTVLMRPAFDADLMDHLAREGAGAGLPESAAEAMDIVSQISVIIPARNEEDTLPPLLESLAAQEVAPLEIIVVDDESEDGTAEIARRRGVRVISAGPRPDGWLGKPWALHRGAGEAAGRFLLFLDADVRLRPHALESLAAALRSVSSQWPERTASISVQPYHRTASAWERISMLFNILVFVGAARRIRPLRLSSVYGCCFGPCILCDRDEYLSFGGHAAISDRVLDDLELGGCLEAAGVTTRSFAGRGVVEFRMYPSGLRAVLDGFTKNILLGAQRASGLFRVLSLLWFAGLLAVLPYIWIAAVNGRMSELVVATVFYTFFVIQIAAAGARLGNFGPMPALFFPFHLAVFLAMLVRAAVLAVSGRNVRWKGRSLEPGSPSRRPA